METQEKQYTDKIPCSTYRLQFNRNFTFKNACEIIPYLKGMGISHCYISPILRAKTGSIHGYDITDHSKLNPEIGTEEDFNELVNIINENNMKIILDIVPNHMGIGNENRWWTDVLENGRASQYANFFDIDWKPVKKELSGKVLVPVLGDHYGNILANGEFKLNFDKNKGQFKLVYEDHEFPINPSSYPLITEYKINELESILGCNCDEYLPDNSKSYNGNTALLKEKTSLKIIENEENHHDFLEYQSIMTVFRNLPKINETDPERIKERNREKQIAYKRLAELCKKNDLITDFIEENLSDFKGHPHDSQACERINKLLEEQAYRPAYWRVSSDIINYRRFFDVNSLICLKTENSEVFNATHSLIMDLIEQGKIHGLRIDHPDGLLDPANYFKNLQTEAGNRSGINFDCSEEKLLSSEQLPFYVAAEKILAPFERLPQNWAVHGTVGYEFLNNLNNLFLETKNIKRFSGIYHRFINKVVDFNELIINCKKQIMKTALTGELSTLSNCLSRISEKHYITRDYTLNTIREALREIIACFPVYRTYISQEDKNNKDTDYIKWAVGMAKKRSKSTDPSIYDFTEKILLCEFETNKDSETYREILNFIMKFQQYTSPLMAKGLEDTGFYNYNRLISLNEVGGNPSSTGISVNDFHNANINRLNTTPHGLLTTSTHDTKLSEDVRARICSLSEIPDLWQKKIIKWSRINKSKKTKHDNILLPDKNDEYLFYQVLTGIWPDETPENGELKKLSDRIENYMIKAAREAKTHTSWININTQYENALSDFIKRVLNSAENHPFRKDFIAFQKDVALRGYNNSISQITLKFTCPGVPDVYQGNEIWKYNLVDPDNRNPVDFNKFQTLFEEIKPLLNNHNQDLTCLFPLESGKLKLFITSTLLNFRKNHSELFKNGNYIPLEVQGTKSQNIIAFTRTYKNETVTVIVPRLLCQPISPGKSLHSEEVWKNTKIILPEAYKNLKLQDIFTKQTFCNSEPELKAESLFSMLPACVLYSTFD